jgi:hypothetical protein
MVAGAAAKEGGGVKKSVTIRFRVCEDVAKKLLAHAEGKGITLSEFMRWHAGKICSTKVLQRGHTGATTEPSGVAQSGYRAATPVPQTHSTSLTANAFVLSSSHKLRSKNSGIKTLHEADKRHAPLKNMLCAAWKLKNGSEAPWNGRSGKALKDMLASVPSWTLHDFTVCIENRFGSEANHAEPPFVWIPKLPMYKAGPLNKFNQPVEDKYAAINRVTSELSFSDGSELPNTETAQ